MRLLRAYPFSERSPLKKGLFVWFLFYYFHRKNLCYRLFTGRKKAPFGGLPAGGVDREIIDGANIYGSDALKAMRDICIKLRIFDNILRIF
jgi:hypothetical protein